MVAMLRLSRVWICAAFVLVIASGAIVGCSGPNPFQAAQNATTTSIAASGTPGTGVAENPFIPDRNISDCVGTNERPNCGSAQKGGRGTWLTFVALILGVGFVMWRISVGVRKRDAVVNQPDHPGQY